MPDITRERAVEIITRAFEESDLYDLVAYYNEIHPRERTSAAKVNGKEAELRSYLLDHVKKGLYDEEIVSFWHLTFPTQPDLGFDEETGLFHYEERLDPADRLD